MTTYSPQSRIAVLLSLIVVAIWLLFLLGCEDENPVSDEGSNIIFPDSGVSYSQHVEPLFQQRCALSGCHAGSSPTAGLNLTTPSYHNLVNNHQPRLVTSGEPQNSLLVQRLDGTIGQRMPLNRQALTPNQINGIRKWIQEGVPNN